MQLYLSWSKPLLASVKDCAKTEVHLSQAAGFTPSATTLFGKKGRSSSWLPYFTAQFSVVADASAHAVLQSAEPDPGSVSSRPDLLRQ